MSQQVLEVITLASSAKNFIGDQMSYMQNNGNYQFHLICSPSNDIEQYALSQGVKYKGVEIERMPSFVKDFKAFLQIRRYIKDNQISIIIAHSFPKAFLLSVLAARTSMIRPFIIEVSHGAVYETLPFFKKHILLFEERIISSFTAKVICVSPSVIKSRLYYRLNKKDKLCLLSKGTSNGVDTIHKFNPSLVSVEVVEQIKKELNLSENDFVIGFCGRLVRDKGIVELLDGFQEIKKRHPDKSIKLLIIGNPEQRDALPQHTLDTINSSSDIIFTGRVPYDIIQNYYLPMDVFVLPSYREGFPTVVLEASAMERPVITTRKTGCIDSIIENETGVFVDIEGSSIADGIEMFFDKEYAERIGKNGRKWVVENFEHEIVREAMLNLLNELTQKQ